MNESDIKSVLVKVSGNEEMSSVSPDDDLFECGLDSLDLMDVIFELDELFGFSVSEEDFARCKTISGILQVNAKDK